MLGKAVRRAFHEHVRQPASVRNRVVVIEDGLMRDAVVLFRFDDTHLPSKRVKCAERFGRLPLFWLFTPRIRAANFDFLALECLIRIICWGTHHDPRYLPFRGKKGREIAAVTAADDADPLRVDVRTPKS